MFVLWLDAAGKWQAFAEICSHRQAPLSDCRINDKGDLECCYPGWSFDGSGKCTVHKGEVFTVQSDTLQLIFHPPYAVFDRMTLPGQKTIWFNFILRCR